MISRPVAVSWRTAVRRLLSCYRTVSDIKKEAPPSGYLFITETDSDEIAKSVSLDKLTDTESAHLEYWAEPVLFVPWCITAADALQQLHKKERETAVVVNELGETIGVITSRDIISLWVARMVLMGLNNVGKIPFENVYIHPKILDGDGETMSKSKGNGIDPLDVIAKFGADALRFGMAHLTTETQDVRMPVQYECPHCEASIDQNRKNRELPRIECPKCNESFSTQWATSTEDLALKRGPV